MLTRPLTRGLTRSLTRGLVRGGVAPYVDPLLEIPALLYVTSHLGDNVPRGINASEDGMNTGWVAEVGTDLVASNGPLTKFENGTPYAELNGIDQIFNSAVVSSLLDSQGSLAVAFRSDDPISFYSTPLGGSNNGIAISSMNVNDVWGLALPGVANPAGTFPSNDQWFVFVVTNSGNGLNCKSFIKRQDGTSDQNTAFTLASPPSSAAGTFAFGPHVSNSPVSYAAGRLIGGMISDQIWTEEQISLILDTFFERLPTL